MKTFKLFSKCSGLKPNILKCEVVSIGSLKGVKMAVCGTKCIDLTTETIKILGVYFSYNQKLQTQKNFMKSITNMQNVLNLWRMKNITLEGKIIIFKTALSKIVFLTLITSFSKLLFEEMQIIQNAFMWNNLTPKIKHKTLCNSFEEGGLKNVDIISKIASLQCSWIKPLYDDKFDE